MVMKELIACIVLSMCYNLYGQVNDTIKIKEAALNYVEGFYNSDTARIASAVHPDLAKRIVAKDSTGYFLVNMTAKQLISASKKYKKSYAHNQDEPFKGEVIIYDIYRNIAMAKIVTNKFQFIDYIQLGKIGDDWKIINVLWTYTK